MCGCCCSEIKHSFVVRKIIPVIAILVNIGLTIFFIVSNAQNYDKYKNRASYVIYHVSNASSKYYIIRENLNSTADCSSNALFAFDVTTVYENIISKQGTRNTVFVTVFWLSMIMATLLSIGDIALAIMAHCKEDQNEYDDFKESDPLFLTLVRSIGSQFLKKGSFLFPTYFISIFDYSQLCLPHHTAASLFLLHHTYIDIFISLFSMFYLILWTWACWDLERHQYSDDIAWIRLIETLACGSTVASVVIFILLCLIVIMIGIYGVFVWVTSLMEFLLTAKAILLCFNFFIGVFYDAIKHFKDC